LLLLAGFVTVTYRPVLSVKWPLVTALTVNTKYVDQMQMV